MEKIGDVTMRRDALSYNIQLGMGYLKQGDMPRAKRKLLTALEIAPKSAEAHGAMGYYLEKTGDQTQAGNYYRKALSLAPRNGSQLNNYGTYLCRLGKYTEADVYFLKAVKDINYVNTAAAYENAGLCATAIPDYQRAETYFTRALEQDPRRRQSLYELVSLELKQQQEEKALVYLQKYQQMVLTDPVLLSMAVDAAHATGKLELESQYKVHLSSVTSVTDLTGEKNERDSANG